MQSGKGKPACQKNGLYERCGDEARYQQVTEATKIMPSALRAAPHACQDGILSMCGLLCVASVQPKFEPLQAVSYEFYKANAASMSQGLL